MILLEILNALLQFVVILMHARVWKHTPPNFFLQFNCCEDKLLLKARVVANVEHGQQIIMNEETNYNFKVLKAQNTFK